MGRRIDDAYDRMTPHDMLAVIMTQYYSSAPRLVLQNVCVFIDEGVSLVLKFCIGLKGKMGIWGHSLIT